MKFRWAIYKNQVNAQMVRDYATENDIPMSLAKKELVDQSQPVLQYLDVYDDFGNGIWVDVPTEIITR